jgi:predicted negative regulator of RcsB-dependent stress response
LTDYLTEEEQIQQLKTWLKQYGPTILLGILIAFMTMTGWRYWQNYHNKTLLHASSIYEEMLTLRAQNNISGAMIQAQKILNHYQRTPYANMAALLIARDAVLKKDYPEAGRQLQWVISHSNNPSLRQTARIRAARILINQQNPNAALNLLKKLDDPNFSGLVNETRGDAWLVKKDVSAARNAYQLALQELPNAEVTRPILVMKYGSLLTQVSGEKK